MHSDLGKKIFAYFRILRLSNFIITFVSIYFAIVIADSNLFGSLTSFLGALSGALIGGAGMIINDYFDFEIDKINRPERPLPSNLISKKRSLIYYGFLNVIALILIRNFQFLVFVIALASIFMIFMYSYKLKKIILVGNIVVSLMTGTAFIFGGAIGGDILKLIIPAIFAFLINLAREILKDIEDMEGDRAIGLKTFPILFGKQNALNLAIAVLGVLIIATFFPFVTGFYKIEYFIVVLFGVDLFLIYAIKSLLNDSSNKNLRKIGNLIKYDMAVGLIAILLGIY